jgi:hypothetical protein
MAETDDLTLDPTLARTTLGWRGIWDWRRAITKTLEWYVAAAEQQRPDHLIRGQFEDYATTS